MGGTRYRLPEGYLNLCWSDQLEIRLVQQYRREDCSNDDHSCGTARPRCSHGGRRPGNAWRSRYEAWRA